MSDVSMATAKAVLLRVETDGMTKAWHEQAAKRAKKAVRTMLFIMVECCVGWAEQVCVCMWAERCEILLFDDDETWSRGLPTKRRRFGRWFGWRAVEEKSVTVASCVSP